MEKDSLYSLGRLATNKDYYNNVFKKTERLVTTIFYIMSHIPKTNETEFFLKTTTDNLGQTLGIVTTSLSFYEYETKDKLFTLQQSLIALESSLRIGNATGIFTDETLSLLITDIDFVQSYLHNHFVKESLPISVQPEIVTVEKNKIKKVQSPRKQKVIIPEGDISSDAHMVYSQLVDRTVRIKTVLEAKPEATIKDIAEVITDVGEKTIQRDLNTMIEQGQVIRQGERRWSKYSLAG